MSNFTTSWKFLEKLEEADKLEFRQIWDGRAGSELRVGHRAHTGELEPPDELEKFIKFYISWKF